MPIVQVSPPETGGVPESSEGGVVCLTLHTTPRLLRRRTPPNLGGETSPPATPGSYQSPEISSGPLLYKVKLIFDVQKKRDCQK